MPLNFWFDFASTYSYPAAMRIEKLAAGRGVRVAGGEPFWGNDRLEQAISWCAEQTDQPGALPDTVR